MRFKHLVIPDGWETYWTKYPQGMTILESLFQWVKQVDNMVDNQNKLSANVEQFRIEIDAFIGRFDERLQDEVTQTLTDWQNSGFLDVVISEALQWELDNYIATNEQDKLSITTQLAQNAINVQSLGAVLDGVSDDSDFLIEAHDKLGERGGKIQVPTGILKLTKLVTFTKNVILEGTSVSQLTSSLGGSAIFTTGEGGLVFRGGASSGIRDIMIDGDKTNGIGLNMLCGRPWIDNVSVVNQGSHGVQIGSETETINVNHWFVNNLRTKENGGDGFKVIHPNESMPDGNAGKMTKIDAGYNKGNGVTLVNVFDNEFSGLAAEGNKGYGVHLINSSSNMFIKPYLENNVLGEMYGDDRAIRNYVLGHRRDTSVHTHIIFENENNYFMGRDNTKGIFPLSNRFGVDKLSISRRGVTGYWDIEQNQETRDLEVDLKGTGSTGEIKFKKPVNVDELKFNTGIIRDYMFTVGTAGLGYIEPHTQREHVVTLEGVTTLDNTIVNFRDPLPSGLMVNSFVSGAGEITIRVFNLTDTQIHFASQSYRISVIKPRQN